jgi:hypothetical protein
MKHQKKLDPQERNDLLSTLKQRFMANMHRHQGIIWEQVVDRIANNPDKLYSLQQMEHTGGEPDVVILDNITGDFIYCDCSTESPKGRRSLCYDPEALAARKENKPAGSATGMAAAMGIKLLSEKQYFLLQQLGDFDTKTSSWLETPSETRAHGGAIFGDKRYARVFVYHNGAESYYAARGFRACVHI